MKYNKDANLDVECWNYTRRTENITPVKRKTLHAQNGKHYTRRTDNITRVERTTLHA